jgi:hypothetical protein
MNETKPTLSRRRIFAGAGTLGALAAAATVLPAATQPAATASAEPAPEPQPRGYRLTDHIERYYRTTRV